MFFRLGFQNAWRNLGRSILAVVSMALAAAFFTYVISLGKGYANQAGQPLRNMLGGEIVVYAEKMTAESPKEEDMWSYHHGETDSFTDISFLFPDMAKTGYLHVDQETKGFSSEEVASLAGSENVDAVQVFYRLPAEVVEKVDLNTITTPLPSHLLVVEEDGTISGPEVTYAAGIQGRDWVTNQEYSLENYLSAGRWFEKTDENKWVGIVSANQTLPSLASVPAPGDTITLEVPSFKWENGKWVTDYATPHRFEIEIIGNLNIVSRTVDYIKGIDGWVTEPVYAYLNEVYLPLSIWNQIWTLVANGESYIPSEVLLRVKDLTYLQDIVFDLQHTYPDFSIIAVPQHLERVHSQLSLEPVIPAGARGALEDRLDPSHQGVIAADLRKPITVLVLLNAGLLVAANILILVSERKKEIAVLKAIGGRENELIRMILAEAVLVSGIGASIGFFFIRIQALLNQWTNSAGFFVIFGLFCRDFLIVLGVTLLSAILFGWIPARKYASLPVMEVLRNE